MGGGFPCPSGQLEGFTLQRCSVLAEVQHPDSGLNMGHENMTKIKEKFALKHAIIKEFLAEFLGIFVLIVSRLPVHLLSVPARRGAEGGCHFLWGRVGPTHQIKMLIISNHCWEVVRNYEHL